MNKINENVESDLRDRVEIVLGTIPDGNSYNDLCDNENQQMDEKFLCLNDTETTFLQPLSERCSPLGADDDDCLSQTSELFVPDGEFLNANNLDKDNDREEYANGVMDDEQDFLLSSLIALTSHFAHLQLRVRQIVEAPTNTRDQLLKDLEEFAFRGLPEQIAVEKFKSNLIEQETTSTTPTTYQSEGHAEQTLLEKQKVIIDELRSKLNLKVEEHDLHSLSSEKLKHQVEHAIDEFIGPLKMKEQLVAQLKTQITDLERFIAFLQCDSEELKLKSLRSCDENYENYNTYAVKKNAEKRLNEKGQLKEQSGVSQSRLRLSNSNGESGTENGTGRSLYRLMDRAAILLQMFGNSHFTSRQESFLRNSLKKTPKGNHWGDLRAQLEIDIQEIIAVTYLLDISEKQAKASNGIEQSPGSSKKVTFNKQSNRSKASMEMKKSQPDFYSTSSDADRDYCAEKKSHRKSSGYGGNPINAIKNELITLVRRNFSITLKRLIEHGLRSQRASNTSEVILMPFIRCLNPLAMFATSSFENSDGDTSSQDAPPNGSMHAWELILKYYDLKQGDQYNNTPAQKLSKSFNLDIVDRHTFSAKQSFLSTVSMIIEMHRPYKRNNDAHFKAFVCAGLNSHYLVDWLKLIFSCSELVDLHYTASSYLVCTGFRDSLRAIDGLMKYKFNLPVDFGIRHLRNV